MAQSISQEAVVNTGLPGATAASRYAGATTSGAPTAGTFAVGDFVIDQSGAMYVCTVAGTPGTWQLSGVSVNENIAGKNFLINGAMDIWQRGTSFTNTANGIIYTSDRWNLFSGTGIAATAQQITSSSTLPTSFQYALRTTRPSGNTSTANIAVQQIIETVNSIPLAGKTVTLSFWMRAGSGYNQGGIWASLVYGTGTDEGASALINSSWTGFTRTTNLTVTPTTTWQKYSVSYSVPSTATEIAIQFVSFPAGTATTNDYFDITGVQLEIAPQATPFSRAGGSIGGELALCQRYYYRQTPSASYGAYGIGSATSGTTGEIAFNLPITMRIAPASLDYSASGLRVGDGVTYYNSYTSVSLDTYWTTNNVAWVIMTIPSSSLTQYRPIFISNSGNTSSYIGVSAEL
jgi:hypothetical protein